MSTLFRNSKTYETLQRIVGRHDFSGVMRAMSGMAQEAAEVQTSLAVADSYQILAAARNEALILKNEVLPAARISFKAAREGYEQGKIGYLDVLDAQRTFFETRARHIEVLASYHRSVAVLESLIGTPLEAVIQHPLPQQEIIDDEK